MENLIFEMIIVGILCNCAVIPCIYYLIRKRIYDGETFEKMSASSCVVMISLIGVTLLTLLFEIIWCYMYLGGQV